MNSTAKIICTTAVWVTVYFLYNFFEGPGMYGSILAGTAITMVILDV